MSNIIYLKKPNRRCGSTTYIHQLALKFMTAPIMVELRVPDWDNGCGYDIMHNKVRYYRFAYDRFNLKHNFSYEFYQHLRDNDPPIFLMDYNADDNQHRTVFDTFRQFNGVIVVEDVTQILRNEQDWANSSKRYYSDYFPIMKASSNVVNIDYC